MGKDPVGGSATNLMPGNKRQDIYELVRILVERQIEKDALSGIKEALPWRGNVTRKLVKRATMTTPYGVTQNGIREQLLSELRQGTVKKDLQGEWKTSGYFARVVDQCITEVVVKSKEIRAWLQDLARAAAKKKRGLRWTLPTGFIAVQEDRVALKRRIVVPGGTLLVHEDNAVDRLDVASQVRGITANFVHSLDAAHMMLTIVRLCDKGLRHFAMVHDSFGVHACDVSVMNPVLREAFVDIYQEPILARFLAEQRRANPEIELKPPPSPGELAIEGVLDSEYFFC
jgi:DNA-directed RNA polymerase